MLVYLLNSILSGHIESRSDVDMCESCLRSLLSLSYVDSVSLWLGPSIPLLLSFLVPPYLTRDCLRYSLEIISNLCVQVGNRRAIAREGGVEALVALHGDAEDVVRDLSFRIVQHLQDATPHEVVLTLKKNIGALI